MNFRAARRAAPCPENSNVMTKIYLIEYFLRIRFISSLIALLDLDNLLVESLPTTEFVKSLQDEFNFSISLAKLCFSLSDRSEAVIASGNSPKVAFILSLDCFRD